MDPTAVVHRRHFLKVGATGTAAVTIGCASGGARLADTAARPRLHTPLCDLLGIDLPIIQSGMAPIGGPELAAAVSNAGGLGILGCAHVEPEEVRRRIHDVRARTDRPFGVNLLLHTQVWPPIDSESIPEHVVRAAQTALNRFRDRLGIPRTFARPATRPNHVPGALEVILEEGVPVLSIGLGNPPRDVVDRFHRAGATVIAMVASVADAREVEASGVDVIIAQGHEAGGHRSTWVKPPSPQHADLGTMTLVPQVIEAVSTPVVAAGGISSGSGIAAALALGAQGVLVGTRFIPTREARASDFHKRALIERDGDSTVVTDAFTGLYARVIRNRFTEEYAAQDAPTLTGYLQVSAARDIYVAATERNDGEHLPLWAGQGIGLIHDMASAGEVVATLARETEAALRRLAETIRLT